VTDVKSDPGRIGTRDRVGRILYVGIKADFLGRMIDA